MTQQKVVQPHFMKGTTRHWFWGALAVLLVTAALRYVESGAITGFVASGTQQGILTGGIVLFDLLLAGLTCMILLAYGLCNKVKIYKVLFIILAGFQLVQAAANILSNLSTVENMRGATSLSPIMVVAVILALLVIVAWVACLLVMAIGRPASAALRVSAILLAGYLLFGFVYDIFLSPQVVIALYQQFGAKTLAIVNMGINALRTVVYVSLNAFFYGAMSFSRRKPPKPLPTQQAPAA